MMVVGSKGELIGTARLSQLELADQSNQAAYKQ